VLAALSLCLTAFDLIAGAVAYPSSPLAWSPKVLFGLFASHMPGALLGASLTGLVAFGHRVLPERVVSESPLGGWKLRVARGALAAALCAYPAALLGASLTSGAWVGEQGYASALRIGFVVFVSAVMAAASLVVTRLWESRVARGGYLVSALGLTLVNASVLPGLYLEAHLALYVFALLLTTWAVLPELDRCLRVASRRHALLPLLASLVLCMAASVSLARMGMRTRSDVIRNSTGISAALSLVAPPMGSDHLARELASLEELLEEEPKATISTKPLGKPPRSVLFVVVDTLRGDALPPVRTGARRFAAPGDTPRLDAWIETTYRFKNAYSQSSQTKASMPSMFRSLEPFEDPLTTGVALSDFARDLGLRPVAVVPQYFLMPAQVTSQALLDGFEVVDFYEKDDQDSLPQKVEGMLDQVRDQPFLAWVHFYNMHSPYYGGEGQVEKGKTGADKYRIALRWLDQQFGVVIDALKRRGLDESTLVILAADHGEHLGEGKRTGHGDGVHDEEVHVPLAFYVPGTKGREIGALAGNLDIVPTLAQLFGREPDSRHRGESLVRAMLEGSARASRSLYMKSGDERVFGLVTQDYKLVYTPRVATFNLYRRAEDPRDARDLFGVDPRIDRTLVSHFVHYDPTLFASELKQEKVLRLLTDRLRKVDPDRSDTELEFLLKAARGTTSPAVQEEVGALYDRATSAEARLKLSAYLGKEDAVWSRRWDELLASVANAPEEAHVVRELSAMGAVSVRSSFAPRRLRQLIDSKSPLLLDWLRLIAPWRKPAQKYGAALAEILAEPEQPSRERLLRLTLENVGSLKGVSGALRKKLEAEVLPLTESSDVLLAVQAATASRASGAKASVERMEQILDSDADPRLKQAALHTLRHLRGEKSIPYILQAGQDPLLLVDAIKLCADLGDERAEPFLRDVAENHYNSWTRRTAKEALLALKRKRQ
jgi:hypothetical protein